MSSANHVTFVGAIRGAAAALDREPSPEQIGNLNLVLQSLGRIDPETGTVSVQTDAGLVPVDAFLAAEAVKFPMATTDTSTNATSPSATPARSQADRDADEGVLRIGASTQYGRPRGDFMADLVRGFQASGRAAAAQEAASHGNPWIEATFNRTLQQILKNNDPALAARMQQEAAR